MLLPRPRRAAHMRTRPAFALAPATPPRLAHRHAAPRCAATRAGGSSGSAPKAPRPKRASGGAAGKARKAPPPRSPGATPAARADLADATELGDTLMDSPVLKSTLMSAMRDYFGDDGREVLDYMKRPRGEKERPQFRVLLGGSGAGCVALAKRLRDDDVTLGLYYVPDGGCPEERAAAAAADGESAAAQVPPEEAAIAKLADRVSAEVAPGDFKTSLVAFARWGLVDAVFLGTGVVPDDVARELERELADAGVTMFEPDVGEAIAEGSLSAFDTLAPIAEAEGEQLSGEALLE